MRESLGQPVLIENVTGASGSIAVGKVARARLLTGELVRLEYPPWHVLVAWVRGAPHAIEDAFAPHRDGHDAIPQGCTNQVLGLLDTIAVKIADLDSPVPERPKETPRQTGEEMFETVRRENSQNLSNLSNLSNLRTSRSVTRCFQAQQPRADVLI